MKVNDFDCVAIVEAVVDDAYAAAVVADVTLSGCDGVNAFVVAAVVVFEWISCVFCILLYTNCRRHHCCGHQACDPHEQL